MTIDGERVTETLRFVAEGSQYSIPIGREFLPASVEVGLDLAGLTARLRARYQRRWGTAFEPIWLGSELVEQRGNVQVYDVTVYSDHETWTYSEFVQRFQLR